VDQIVTYSKHPRLIAAARQALAAPQNVQRQPAEPVRAHRIEDRISAADRAGIVAAYANGETLAHIIDRFDTTRYIVRRLADEAGVPRRIETPSPEDEDRAVLLYECGDSLAKVGLAVGFDPCTVRRILISRGIPRRDSHGRVR